MAEAEDIGSVETEGSWVPGSRVPRVPSEDDWRVKQGQTVSLDALHDLEDFEALGIVGQLRHEGLTMVQVEKQLRMRHVLAQLPPDQASLLVERFVSRRTLEDLAEELEVSHVAVLKRVRAAMQNFRVAFGEHWLCDLEPSALDNAAPSPLDYEHG